VTAGWRHPFSTLAAYLDRRSRQQQAIRVMVGSGVLRSADHGIRYTMTPKELKDLLYEPTEDLA